MKELLLPPLCLFVLALVLWGLARLLRLPARWPVGVSVAVAYVVCTPFFGETLLATRQSYPPLRQADLQRGGPGAVVVLSAGLKDAAPEYGGTLLDGLSIERLLYAGFLGEQTGLPVLVSGGRLRRHTVPLAAYMAQFLATWSDAEVRWREARSSSTWENAAYSAATLRAAGIERAYLVTHAWHMPRAVYAFRQQGFDVVPAPTGFVRPPDLDVDAFLPSFRGLKASYYGLYELYGGIAYRLLK